MKFVRVFLLVAAAIWGGGCYDIPNSGGGGAAPAVQSQSLWIITIDDWAARANNPNTRTLLNDAVYWQGLKSRGHEYRQIDSASDQATTYEDKVQKAGGTPCVIIGTKAGSFLAAVKLPQDKTAMDALLKKYGG